MTLEEVTAELGNIGRKALSGKAALRLAPCKAGDRL